MKILLIFYYVFLVTPLRYSRSGVHTKLQPHFYKLFPNINVDGETWFGRGFYSDSRMFFFNPANNSNIFFR